MLHYTGSCCKAETWHLPPGWLLSTLRDATEQGQGKLNRGHAPAKNKDNQSVPVG